MQDFFRTLRHNASLLYLGGLFGQIIDSALFEEEGVVSV